MITIAMIAACIFVIAERLGSILKTFSSIS
jgi:hypothetical protein